MTTTLDAGHGPAGERGSARLLVAGVALPERWATHPVVAAEASHDGWDATDVWFDDAGPHEGGALLARLRWRERSDGYRPYSVETDPAGVSLFAVGSAEGAARLVLRARAELEAAGRTLGEVVRSTAPRGTRAVLARLAAQEGVVVPSPFDVPAGGEWDWMSIDHHPAPQPGEDRVEELVGETGRAEAAAVLAAANPHGELALDEPRSRWWGWRDGDGVLRGVVGASRRVPGRAWVLGSIGTDPALRGRGVAAATTAVAVRAGLAEAPVVTLGMYASNEAARRTYRRVGFTLGQEFESTR
ncbi:N-acetyltransferase [Xylanimonas oleitrophica]|uniref:N-acetyltransferase n=1 Tax=Xylanimonas oleitrophica TaxID=2607479 RepID=A0A2W5YEB8_9MICO|nr:GNAT family N-acetyltransferase [Xylanimonas oleitrophica]PZR52741.1 N-acetyltransferase [Xylanimonas oleitrophica]